MQSTVAERVTGSSSAYRYTVYGVALVLALVMISTGWRFFADSYNMSERSLETWQVQYWPVKGTLLLGAVLILLAGISHLIKDIRRFERACQEHH